MMSRFLIMHKKKILFHEISGKLIHHKFKVMILFEKIKKNIKQDHLQAYDLRDALRMIGIYFLQENEFSEQ